MKSDIFVLIPCHVDKSYSHLKTFSSITSNKYTDEYLEKMKNISASELVDRVSNSFERYFLGEYDLLVLADELSDSIENKKVIDSAKIKLFITACERTRLSVLVGVICDYEGNPTNILDQITREELVLQVNKRVKVSDFIRSEFQIIKNGEAKTCLIQNEKSSIDDVLYYMATETNDSSLVDTKIISSKYHQLAVDNLAVYDFSDIYVSESVIYQVLHDEDGNDRLQYEGLLIFIVELLVMQLSAVFRTNNKVALALEENQSINVKEYEKFSNEFANTLSIWQINIYRYKGAQTIANAIAERFEIEKVRKNYKQNDEFLQSIINTRNVKNAMKESNILFYVAILLFIKDFYLIVKNIYLFFSGSQEVAFGDIFSISTSFVILLIVLLIYHGRFRTIGKRKL
jgi:hypothetical protein